MNAWVLLVQSVLLLALPGILLNSWMRSRVSQNRPEISGALRPMHSIIISYCALLYRLKTNGWAPLPEHGPAILIANHTCGIDHLILQASCQRVLGFMIAREYYEWPSIHWFCKLVHCIPVNRDGRDIHATRRALGALAEGRVLPIFPEGRITPLSGREIGKIRPGAAFIAVRSGAPVFPAYIRGTPPTNQIGESLLTPSAAVVTFGPPIDLSDFEPGQAGDKDVQAEVSRRFLHALLDLQARSRNEVVQPVGIHHLPEVAGSG
jgi:1-acyl-sn-glycerol-3-phosphate acyltransferase